ncbi:MAG: PH domain-containing protein [Methanobacteriota archaeon]|nr:MAG: PH domain-containing protein [Euryarchaeota archaeon]
MEGEFAINSVKEGKKKVSRKVLIAWIFRWLVVLFAIIVVVGFFEDRVPILREVFLFETVFKIAIVLLIVLLILDEVKYEGISYELTDEGIIVEKGVLKKNHYMAPYDHIQDIDIERTLIERILGIGTVIIDTAGISSKKAQDDIEIPGIENPHRFAKHIIEKVTAVRRGKSNDGVVNKEVGEVAEEVKMLKEAMEGVGQTIESYEERVKRIEELTNTLQEHVIKLVEEKRREAERMEEERRARLVLLEKSLKKPAKREVGAQKKEKKSAAKTKKTARKNTKTKTTKKKTTTKATKKSSKRKKK